MADAGMASPADLAEVVTVGVASLADACAASLAHAGMVFPTGLAGVVTLGMASLADAGVVTVGVTDLADAGEASLTDAEAVSLADPAGSIAGAVTDLNVPAPIVTDAISLLQGCVDDPEYGDNVSPDVSCQEMPQIQNDLDYQYVNCVSCDPVGMDYAVLAESYTCSFETLLSEPLCTITDDMTYQEKIEALSGTVYDYDEVIDNQPGYFDYDDPRDYEEWCDWDDSDEGE